MNSTSMTPSSRAGWSELLLDAACPGMYRSNAFRTAGLPVDATARDINRQMEKIRILEKYGTSTQRLTGALPLDPPPPVETVQDAIQHLRDPERRLIDEFFWFWPHQLGDSRHDAALGALGRNDIKAAMSLWLEYERGQSESNVSMHNLAVLQHTLALDLEHEARTNPLNDTQLKGRDQLWKETFKRWAVLLEDEGLWKRLTLRIQELQDPRLTTGTAARIRETLPLALILINAQLALEAAQRGDAAEVERQKRIIGLWPSASKAGSAEGGSLAEEAFRRVLKPIVERIRTFSKTAREQGDRSPETAGDTALSFIDQANSLLPSVDALLPAGNAVRDGIHDEAAQTALSCQIQYGNKTKDWDKSISILNRVISLAASETVKSRVSENLKILESNNDFKKLYGICHFCQEAPAEDASVLEVPMHGDVSRIPIAGGTRVTWRTSKVRVPRCPSCKSYHSKAATASGIGGALGGMLGLGSCIAIASANSDSAILGFIVMGVIIAIGAGIGSAIGNAGKPMSVRPQTAKGDFPEITKLKSQGWSFGAKPAGVQ
jgi:hypothetical protein